MTWQEIQRGWSEGWWSLWEDSKALYDDIVADPEEYAAEVGRTIRQLDEIRATLDAMKPRLKLGVATDRINWVALNNRYAELAAGIYVDAGPVREETGVVPILVVLGLVVGVAAIAWAVTAHEYVGELHGQTALAAAELDARIKASREGRSLQSTTLPAQDGFTESTRKIVGYIVVGGLVLVTGAVAIPLLVRRTT